VRVLAATLSLAMMVSSVLADGTNETVIYKTCAELEYQLALEQQILISKKLAAQLSAALGDVEKLKSIVTELGDRARQDEAALALRIEKPALRPCKRGRVRNSRGICGRW
jgi:hypothetical protein